ncbi:MAG: SPOR domain-containing protein [Halioglobus sp.]
MARDYAKRSQSNKSRRTSDKRKPAQRTRKKSVSSGSGVRIFFAGVLTGVFASFLLYLSTLDADPNIEHTPKVTTHSPGVEKTAPRPRFDFYKLLPEQTIDIDVEPAPDVGSRRSANTNHDVYVLQAGSFRQREDADRRRAELLLLSLAPSIEETTGDNGRWFRVYLGPFQSKSAMARARSLTANQDIDTLLLKREAP